MSFRDTSDRSVSVLANYFIILNSALKELGKHVAFHDVESLTVEVVRAMGSELRDYHKPEHSLDVSNGQAPVAVMAGIFHDIVYVQVDPTWRLNFKSHLGNFLPDENLKLNAKKSFETEMSKLRKAIIALFGMENSEEVIPGKGINEVLSALVMEHMLSKHLDQKEILSIAACIESTIPFRKVDADGKTPADRLRVRMDRAGKLIGVEFTEAEKEKIVDWCRGVVEKDLSSFASQRLNTFLSNTWNVMNENNPALRNAYFYVSEYRKAVYGVIPFLNSLNPDQMFWNAPDGLDVSKRTMVDNTKKNIKLGCEYLKVVGISLSIVEAIALETGGDLPFETMVGPTRKSREHIPVSIGAFLPSKDFRELSKDEKDVFLILKNGRDLRARFDRKESPLGAYLYQSLSSDQIEILYQQAMSFHAGKSSAVNFLHSLSEAAITDIVMALSRACILRSYQMVELMHKLNSEKAA